MHDQDIVGNHVAGLRPHLDERRGRGHAVESFTGQRPCSVASGDESHRVVVRRIEVDAQAVDIAMHGLKRDVLVNGNREPYPCRLQQDVLPGQDDVFGVGGERESQAEQLWLRKCSQKRGVLLQRVRQLAHVPVWRTKQIVWPAVAIMAVGALAGGALGGRLAGRIPPGLLRGLVVCIGVAVGLFYLFRH